MVLDNLSRCRPTRCRSTRFSPEAFADAARGLLTEALPLVAGAVTEPGDLLALTLPAEGFGADEDGTPRANLAPLI